MKKEDLIKMIEEKIPNGADVVIFDHRRNLDTDFGEGSGNGIYKDFSVENFSKEEIKDGCIPFSALSFDNDEYDEEGNHESIVYEKGFNAGYVKGYDKGMTDQSEADGKIIHDLRAEN